MHALEQLRPLRDLKNSAQEDFLKSYGNNLTSKRRTARTGRPEHLDEVLTIKLEEVIFHRSNGRLAIVDLTERQDFRS